MKYRLNILLLVVLTLILTGCSKDIELTEKDIDKNTLVIREDGSLQVAQVDLFDQDYYDLTEFEGFMDKEINTYNTKHGDKSVVFNSISENAKKVVVILSYKSMEDYTTFNNIEGQLINAVDIGQDKKDLPEEFMDKKGNIIPTADIIHNDDYKIFSIKENTDIIIDGKVLYYYNANYIDSSTIKSDGEEVSYVIYKDTFF